ncbi:MAG TPA: right-handed parallel beta-helix repeat-containing protein [Verrucomicrobiae bacterium]|nr:right-handed parallel beta-helix repeat-containing protein [Verrucomicrobiae bacterium]
MKINSVFVTVLSLLVSNYIFAQGSLTPPGAPAPTMKSLDQIEPRIPVSASTTPGNGNNLYIISQPGSYYLTTNIVTVTNYGATGIEILPNNVTLDLNGFSVICTSTNIGTYGIYIPNTQTNITVRNGTINGWYYGVFSINGDSANLVFERLNAVNCVKVNNSNGYGMTLNGPAVLRDCTFEGNGTGAACNNNVSTGSSVITGCTASHNYFSGIVCSGSGIISDCTANNNSSVGIDVAFNQFGSSSTDGCLVSGCTVNNNYFGIYIQGARNRIENNHAVNNSYGIYVYDGGGPYTNNIIVKNSVEGSGVANYTITGAQIVGPFITNTMSGIITNLNPWANFSF